MSVSLEELAYIQAQLDGLESIFFELMPFGVELKRQNVQDYYNKRLELATKPQGSVAEIELKRQFNTKANQVRNLIDSAESFGNVGNKFNLIRAAATIPDNRHHPLSDNISTFCKKVLFDNEVDPQVFAEIMASNNINPIEARVLLASVIFLVPDELNQNDGKLPVRDLLYMLLHQITSCKTLSENDPFLIEAKCALSALHIELGK